MIKSKFNLRIFLPFLILVVIAGVLYLMITQIILVASGKIPFIAVFAAIFFAFIVTWILFGEIRSKLTVVSIDHNYINVNRWLGAGISRSYAFNELDGFRISFLPSEYNEFEYLYLLKENKKIIKLSSFYHQNYDELKHAITVKAKNLGEEKFSLLRELKEIFAK